MSRVNQLAESGNLITINVDGGKVIGVLQNISFEDNFNMEPLSGIGDIHTLENVPTTAAFSGRVSLMVLNTDALNTALGGPITDANAPLKGLVYDIAVSNKKSGKEVARYIGGSIGSASYEITKHQITARNLQWVFLDKAEAA